MTQLGEKKDAVMAEGVAMHETFNAVDQLMQVHAKQADKQAVFETFK